MRHGCASLARTLGGSVDAAMSLTGHRDSKVAESYAKVMTADFVISLSRKIEDKIGNTGRFHVIKNRFGIDGITYPATINTNIGMIQLLDIEKTKNINYRYKG
mgnify:CR=1 FL=1